MSKTLALAVALTASAAVAGAAANLARSEQPRTDAAAAEFAAFVDASGIYPGGAVEVGIADPATLAAAWKTCAARTLPDSVQAGLVLPYIYDEPEQTLLVGDAPVFLVTTSGADGVLQHNDRSWCALAVSGMDVTRAPAAKAVDRCLKQTYKAFQARQAVVPRSPARGAPRSRFRRSPATW